MLIYHFIEYHYLIYNYLNTLAELLLHVYVTKYITIHSEWLTPGPLKHLLQVAQSFLFILYRSIQYLHLIWDDIM